MGRKRTGWTREKQGVWYVGLTLRSGKQYEKPVPAPPDGLPIDDNYLALVRSKLVRAYDSGEWDPEAPSAPTPVEPTPEHATVVEYVRAFAKSCDYESAEKDRSRVEKYVAVSPIAQLPLREFTAASARALLSFLKGRPSQRGGMLGSSAVRNIVNVCSRALDEAVEDGLLTSNPFRQKPTKRKLPRRRFKDPRASKGWWFRREEVEALISDPRIELDRRVMYAVLFLTGMRFGELAALRFGDWDRTARPLTRITIALAIKSVTKTEGPTKTETEKLAPVHPVLEAILAEWFERGWARYMGRSPSAEDYVTPSIRGRRKGRPRNGSTATRTFHRDCVMLGLRSRHLYCTRHTFITLTQDADGVGAVLRWITHVPRSNSYDRYTRERWSSLCREISKLQIQIPEGALSDAASVGNTLENTLECDAIIVASASNQGTSGGSTEESNLPRDA